jgi:hypothetical protein
VLLCAGDPGHRGSDEIIRSFYAELVTQFGYTGFSWEIDDIFHRRSIYLVISDGAGNLVMNCRGTHRRPGEILPFEMALRDNGPSYALDPDRPVMDFNTYTYRSAVRVWYSSQAALSEGGAGSRNLPARHIWASASTCLWHSRSRTSRG